MRDPWTLVARVLRGLFASCTSPQCTAGASLMLLGVALGSLTYVLMGYTPLMAVWFGVTLTGFSLVATSFEDERRPIARLLESFEETLASIVEQYRALGHNLYIPLGGHVYILASNERLPPKTEPPRNKLVVLEGDRVVVVLRSPITAAVLHSGDTCDSIDTLIVDEFRLAKRVSCIDTNNRVVIKIFKPILRSPKSLEKSIGSLYAIVSASIAALLKKRPVRVQSDNAQGDTRIVLIEVLGGAAEV